MPRDTRPDPASRGRILDAARELLSERAHEGLTVQAVAQRAGVSSALVFHYFGTKHGVITATMEDLPRLLPPTPEPRADGVPHTGAGLLRTVLERWESQEWRIAVTAIIRCSVTHPTAARLLDSLLSPDRLGLGPVGDAGAPRYCEHTLTIGAQLVGVMSARHVIPVEPIASAGLDEVAALLGPTVQRCLIDHARAGCAPLHSNG
jgi:AcrR family transcriptional regulator